MEYELMIPPKEVGDFWKFSKEDAKEHFEWYISQIPFRLKQLEEFLNNECDTNLTLNYEPSSLIPLWEWFENNIKVEKLTEEEIQEELKKYPEWLHEEIRKNDTKFTTLSLAIGMDIAIYFAETFIRNNPSVKWWYFIKPKSHISVNRPVLLGFINKVDLDPRRIVFTCMQKSMEEKNSNRLFNAYNTWLEYIDNQNV